MNNEFQPDVIYITEALSKKLLEKKKTINDFINILQQIAEIEDNYSRCMEKISIDLNKIIDCSQKDSFIEIMQYVRNYLQIKSEQSKNFVEQLKNDVIDSIQNFISFDSGWINTVNSIQKKHGKDVRRNIDELHQLQEEYIQAMYEEIRYQNKKIQVKKHNYKQSQTKLQNYVLFYNQYLDTYFQDIAQFEDIYLNIEIDRRRKIQDVGMKYFMFEISYIRNLQYDVSGIAQKVESFNTICKINENYILPNDDKPLLSKLNVDNYISTLQQSVNFQDIHQKKLLSQENCNSRKVDFISANQSLFQQYHEIFIQALKFSSYNNTIVTQLSDMLKISKPNLYFEAFISTIKKVSDYSKDDQGYQVTPSAYITCFKFSSILLDYCNSQNQFALIVYELLVLSKSIYKLISVNSEINDFIQFYLFEDLRQHPALTNIDLWLDFVKTNSDIEKLQLIQCQKDLIEKIKQQNKL